MKTKSLSLAVIFSILFVSSIPQVFATGLKEGTSSLLLPTTGQSMNGESSAAKTKLMAGVEVLAVTTVAVLGVASGGGIVWAGLGPLIVNHVWSAADAYSTAQKNQEWQQPSIAEAQKTLELSRQRRFEHEQAGRYDIRERVRQAGEQASY